MQCKEITFSLSYAASPCQVRFFVSFPPEVPTGSIGCFVKTRSAVKQPVKPLKQPGRIQVHRRFLCLCAQVSFYIRDQAQGWALKKIRLK
jgi:hypothetical protein